MTFTLSLCNSPDNGDHSSFPPRPKPANQEAVYLEAEDDGPDETQREPVVAVDDVVGAHVLQVDPLLLEELEGLVHVLQAVDPHAASCGPRLGGRERGLLI